MEALISQFTFLSDQALHDKNFDPSTIEDLMKLFEIEAYNSWAAVELEQQKETREAEISMQQAEDYLDSVMEDAMDEFRRFEEEFDRMAKAELNSLVETSEKARKMGNSMENAASVASKRYIEAALNAATASMKSAWKGISSNKVTSPFGNNLHHKENITHGQFAFTTNEAGNYLACFWLSGQKHEGGEISVNLDWRTGIAAKDWETVARKEKIEGVELELRKLEGAVEAIHENLLYLRDREADMRTVSEKTNARVAWLSIMSLAVCIGASTIQLWYLKRFFLKKKLI